MPVFAASKMGSGSNVRCNDLLAVCGCIYEHRTISASVNWKFLPTFVADAPACGVGSDAEFLEVFCLTIGAPDNLDDALPAGPRRSLVAMYGDSIPHSVKVKLETACDTFWECRGADIFRKFVLTSALTFWALS
jgi:hypothetical protein